MKALRTLCLLSIALIAYSTALGGIRPSFLPEQCSWRATDIVVVTEGKQIDGVFRVLETWKGDLKPGETIKIDELAEFRSKDTRRVSSWWSEKQNDTEAVYVTGDRMVLFLRDEKEVAEQPNNDDLNDEDIGNDSKANGSRWQSTNPMGNEAKYSTVWIEKGQVYCFVQQMNPGPSLLSKAAMTETKLRNEVANVLGAQGALNGAIAIPDPGRRAQSLQAFVHHRIYLARERALVQLTACGEAALPILRELLKDESMADIHSDLVDALVAAGGKTIGPELTLLVENETRFWRKTAPALKPGWWNGEGFDSIEAVTPLRDRWGVLQQVLLGLKDVRYSGSEKAVSEFSDLLRSMPQLYDAQISQMCDEILRASGPNENERRLARIPAYEIRFNGNKAFSSQVLEAKFAEFLADYERLVKPYDGDIFHYGLFRLGDFMSSQGYLWGLQTSTGANERGVTLSVDVKEGIRYRLGEIRIEGAKVFSPEQLRAMLTLRSGDVVDFAAVHKWLFEDLEKEYKNLGYLQYSADDDRELRPATRDAETGIADLKITITEGLRLKVQSITFEGKTDISRADLRTALKLQEGSVYSQETFEASIEAINKLGLDIDVDNDVRFSVDEEHSVVSILIILDKRTSRKVSGEGRLGKRLRRIFNY